MKNNSGVTISSLTVYVIVLIIILAIFSFVSSNLATSLGDVTKRGAISNEEARLYAFILADIKSSNRVTDFSDDYVRFDNDKRYTIKNVSTSSENKYEIYRDGVLLSENVNYAKFDYDIDKNEFTIKIHYPVGKITVQKEQSFLVGRGY